MGTWKRCGIAAAALLISSDAIRIGGDMDEEVLRVEETPQDAPQALETPEAEAARLKGLLKPFPEDSLAQDPEKKKKKEKKKEEDDDSLAEDPEKKKKKEKKKEEDDEDSLLEDPEKKKKKEKKEEDDEDSLAED